MIFLNKKGVVTVFLCIILPVIIGSCVLLSDACLYNSGKRIIESSVSASTYTVLGKYSGYLKENYDLYAYCISPKAARRLIQDSIKVNLGQEKFFDFKIEDVCISMEGSILDSEILLSLIKKTAADDVYRGIVDEFMERFNVFSSISSAADIITLKMKFDKAYKKIKDSITGLNKIINGDRDLVYYVNLAGVDSGFSEAVLLFNEYRLELVNIENKIEALIEEIKEKPSERVGLKILLEEKAAIVREKMADTYASFIEGFVDGLKKANQKAVEHIQDIVIENRNIHRLSELLKANINKMDNCPVYLKEIIRTCAELLKDVESAFVEQIFEELRIKLDNNISVLLNLKKLFYSSVDNSDGSAREIDIGIYNSNLVFVADTEIVTGRDKDRRGFFEALGKRVLEKRFGKDTSISETRNLPSDGTNGGKSEFNVTSLGQDTQSGEAEINKIKQKTSVISELYTNLAVNEYLLHHFNYENSNKTRESLFKNEIEYLLWGSKSQNSNTFFTKAALMSTRFALDAIHVYSDSSKGSKAQIIAAATAGWWTMGAGIPIMSNLIKISWAIAEAGIDTRKLWKGESVAIIKTKGDWITDIGIEGKGIKSPDFLKMDYCDYMRIFLMTIPMEKKLLRMLDIIDLNSTGAFSVFKACTKVTVKAMISYRSLTGGRHEIEVSASSSY